MLRIITGRSGTGKTTLIINEIIERLNNSLDNSNILLFVPDQMSHQAEYEIAKKVGGKAYSRLQVLSFKRLAHRIFLEVGGINKTFISDITVNMIITKIINDNKDKFQLYNKLSTNYSFVQMVKDVIKEFKAYLLSPEIIDEIIKRTDIDETLRKKLHDLRIIYLELRDVYGDKLLDNEDFYYKLAEKIQNSNYIKNLDIYIDGYHNFTAVELEAVFQMIKTCKNLTILFTLDNIENELFSLPYKTFSKVRKFALDNKIEVKIKHLNNECAPRFKNAELLFLENNYDKEHTFNEEVKNIKIYETENPESLVHQVARLIFNDVYQNNTIYSDYVIYLNNQSLYYPLIQNIFPLYNIPVFIDDKKSMLDHFLLNFIDAVLECLTTNFSYEAMFRMIKTEVFMPLVYQEESVNEVNFERYIRNYRKRIDLLENYSLSHGILGKDWEKEYWEYDLFKKLSDRNREKTKSIIDLEKIINETKNEITKHLLKFKNEFLKATCVNEQISALYNLLVDIDIPKKLNLYEKVHSRKESNIFNLNEAKKHKQVYNHLLTMFDEIVEVCGNYQISTKDLIRILRTGFQGMKFAIVPPAIDQVMVGTLKRSRFELLGHFDDVKTIGVKKAIVLGVNENEIPKVETEKGLITDKERDYLNKLEIPISPTLETNLQEEYFIIYKALTSCSDELILTYTLSDETKKASYPSEIIDKVKNLFPKIKVETLYDFPSLETNNLNYITTKQMTAKLVLNAVNNLRKGYPVSEVMKALYGYFKHSNELRKKLIGITYVNEPENLTTEDIKKIYGSSITASISSVEGYNHCPYAHFLDRTLQVKPRDIKKIEVMDIGDIYHEVLKDLTQLLISKNQVLSDLQFSEIEKLVKNIIEKYVDKVGRKYFLNNKKNYYLLMKIQTALINSLKAMHYQSKYSKFKTFAVEEKFSVDAKRFKIKPYQLSTGLQMNLKGFIDRIDVANLNDDIYVRIMDYKSGNNDIDFTKIYHRLSLQLFTYLDVVLNNSKEIFQKEAYPAGVLYYRIQNSEISATEELDEKQILAKHYEQYKMNGYTLASKDVSPLFDSKVIEGDNSDIIRVGFKKDGNYSAHSKVLNIEEINALRKYTNKAIIDTMEELTSGNIPIKPVKYRDVSHCKYCNFRSICKFDATLKENSYNEINKSGDNEEIIQKIISELSDKDE